MAHDHSAHHGADAEYQPVSGSSYEHTDADVRSIVHFGIWLVVIAVATHFLLGGAFAGMVSFSNESAEPRYPLAEGRQPPKPPAPVLQQYPDREMTAFRSADGANLQNYGWIDKAAGTVHIPIDEAIRLTLERGLPARDAGAAPTEPSGMMATDASAGRVLERRRQ